MIKMNESEESAASTEYEDERKSIRELQQDFAENSGYEDKIIWDLLMANQKVYLEKKMKHLIPDQEKGNSTIEKIRSDLLESVWSQRKYTNGVSLTSIFYVIVTNETHLSSVLDSTKYSIHPVFRTQKCTLRNGDSSGCCMIFVDETGRVYQDWNSYVKENVLPPGTMVAPRNGVYNFDEHNNVELYEKTTPNGEFGARTMQAVGKGMVCLGLGAALVPVAGLCLPVAAPLIAASSTICGAAGVFSGITSVRNLYDRSTHEQSIKMNDAQARNSWLGVLGAGVGVSALGATKVMTSMATAGKTTAGLETVVNALNVTSIVISGTGVTSGILDLITKKLDNEDIETVDVVQLAASLVLFTHSLYNLQMASRIVEDARSGYIRDYRQSLSNRQKKMFEKLSKETMRIRGSEQGKIDIIRNINEIPDRQYLNDLYKVNKPLNQKNVRPAFASKQQSGIVLNDQVSVDTNVLRQSVQHNQGPTVLESVTNTIPQTKTGTKGPQNYEATQAARVLFSPTQQNNQGIHPTNEYENEKTPSHNMPDGLGVYVNILHAGIQIGTKLYEGKFFERVMDPEGLRGLVAHIYDRVGQAILDFFLQITQKFVDEKMPQIRLVISTESILCKIYEYCRKKYENNLTLDFLKTKFDEILEMLIKEIESMNPRNIGTPTMCSKCWGSYSVINL